MANEFKHVEVGTSLTEAEYDAITAHACDSQASGDILYASSATQISRLGKGTDGDFLSSGTPPSWVTHAALITGIHGYTVAQKTSDQIVGNESTVLVNVTEMVVALAANEKSIVDVWVYHVGSATADIDVAFTGPSGCFVRFGSDGDSGLATEVMFNGNTTNRIAVRQMIVINGATAGNLQLQAAQNVSTAVDTKVLTGSALVKLRLV